MFSNPDSFLETVHNLKLAQLKTSNKSKGNCYLCTDSVHKTRHKEHFRITLFQIFMIKNKAWNSTAPSLALLPLCSSWLKDLSVQQGHKGAPWVLPGPSPPGSQWRNVFWLSLPQSWGNRLKQLIKATGSKEMELESISQLHGSKSSLHWTSCFMFLFIMLPPFGQQIVYTTPFLLMFPTSEALLFGL